MRRELLVGVTVAVLVLVVALGSVLLVNQGSHMALEGSIQKVRTAQVEPNATILVMDFRLRNPADYRYLVRSVKVVADVEGAVLEADPVAEVDTARVFAYYASLGQKFNPTLKVKETIAPGETVDRMAMVRLEASEAKVAGRKALKLLIEESDGVVTTITEGAAQ